MIIRHLLAIAFISSSLLQASDQDWQLYTPEELPPGKIMSFEEAATLTKQPGDEKIYVIGDFVVTLNSKNQALLRPEPAGSKIRLLVEYPDGYTPPAVGSKISRDAKTPYLVVDVKSTSQHRTDVHVREIIKAK